MLHHVHVFINIRQNAVLSWQFFWLHLYRLTASSKGHYCNEGRISRSIGTNSVQWILIQIYSKWTGLPQNNLWGIHLHMGYTYLTNLVHPKKLHRSLGTDLPYIPRWVIVMRQIFKRSIILKVLLRPPHGVPVDILAFSNKILFTEEPTDTLVTK